MQLTRRQVLAAGLVAAGSSASGGLAVRGDQAAAELGAAAATPSLATDVQVGCYYYPGNYSDAHARSPLLPWSGSEWDNIARFAEPRPLLGFYNDALPAVADWHIEWARQHGVTFFAFDWYWNQGREIFERSLHEGFLKAERRREMRLCLHWCNSVLREVDTPISFSLPVLRDLTDLLADRYLQRPEYLRLGGRLPLFVFMPMYLIGEHGIDGCARALDAMRKVAAARGLADLLLIGVHQTDTPEHVAVLKDAGFDAYSAYTCAYYSAIGPRYAAHTR